MEVKPLLDNQLYGDYGNASSCSGSAQALVLEDCTIKEKKAVADAQEGFFYDGYSNVIRTAQSAILLACLKEIMLNSDNHCSRQAYYAL